MSNERHGKLWKSTWDRCYGGGRLSATPEFCAEEDAVALERCRIRDGSRWLLWARLHLYIRDSVICFSTLLAEMRWTSSKSPAQSRCSLNRRGTSERTLYGPSQSPQPHHSQVSWTPQAALFWKASDPVLELTHSCFDIYRTFNLRWNRKNNLNNACSCG